MKEMYLLELELISSMPTDDSSIPRSILLLVLLILCGGFFAGTETAFSYCNRIRMKRYAEEGRRSAKRVEKILDSFDKLLTTILIGTNACYVTASSLATVIAVSLWGEQRGAAISTVVITLSVFFFAETVPKNIARVNADTWACMVSLPIRTIMAVLTPISFIFASIGNMFRRLIHAQEAPSMTEDEFAAVIEDVQEDGLLEPEEGALIKSAIEFSDVTALDVMTPVDQMVGIEVSDSQQSIRQKILDEKYSRLPLYRGEASNVIGVLRSKELLRCLMQGKEIELTQYMTPPYFIVPEMKLDALFEGLGRRRTHIAFVMGDSGVQGFVTMENILESLVGEIYDEDDESESAPAEEVDAP